MCFASRCIYGFIAVNITLVAFVHGGPGGGTDGKDRSFFDPTKYKVCYIAFLCGAILSVLARPGRSSSSIRGVLANLPRTCLIQYTYICIIELRSRVAPRRSRTTRRGTSSRT